jgi:hypothetical protein
MSVTIRTDPEFRYELSEANPNQILRKPEESAGA